MSDQTNSIDMVCQVRKAIARALEVPVEVVPPDAAQGSLERWDSLGHLNVIMELEAQFGVTFSTDEAVAIRSVPDAMAAVGRHLHAN